jgi:hypothetical protein
MMQLLQSGVLDLSEEAGLLAANDHFVRQAIDLNETDTSRKALLPGGGHSIHKIIAEFIGSVVIYPDVACRTRWCLARQCLARCVLSGAVVTHAVVGPGKRKPEGAIVATACGLTMSTNQRAPVASPRMQIICTSDD